MYKRNINRPRKIPLVVTEVVLPQKNPAECSQTYFNKDFGTLRFDNSNAGGHAATAMNLGSHEIKQVNGLQVLDKRPLNDYFEGTKQKKESKKKVRYLKSTKSLGDFISQTKCSEDGTTKEMEHTTGIHNTTDRLIAECLSRDEMIRRKKCLIKLQNLEIRQKNEERFNRMKQRLLEKKYIQEQQNLYDTWMAVLKRRKQLKESSTEKNNYLEQDCRFRYSDRITLSVISREYWDDDDDDDDKGTDKPPPEKPEEKGKEPEEEIDLTRRQTIMDGLSGEFLEKLVFVDDESDE